MEFVYLLRTTTQRKKGAKYFFSEFSKLKVEPSPSKKYYYFILIALNLAYNKKNFRLLIQKYAQIYFFKKGPGNSFSTKMCL